MVDDLLWTNLGHMRNAWGGHVDACRAECTFNGMAPKVVVSVRDPYGYWRSLFTYAWVGDGSALGIPAGVDSFTGFVRWADAQASARSDGAFEHSLSFTLYLACGHPCRHDYLLRTETLETDWYRMLSTLELPLVALPHSNPTKLYMRPPPPTIFTWEVVEIIDRLESSVFDEFGYVRREAPFELRV